MIQTLECDTLEVRQRNLERKARPCLCCGQSFLTTLTNRICGTCHKIVDRFR